MPTFSATIIQDDDTSGCGVKLPFKPEDLWGKVRVPVIASLNGHSYRTTIFRMAGEDWIPMSKEHRTAVNVAPGDTVRLTLTLDTAERTITPPADLAAALKRTPGALNAWNALSYSHQREHAKAVEEAKKPETRARRIENALAMLTASKPKKPKATPVAAITSPSPKPAKTSTLRKPTATTPNAVTIKKNKKKT